MRQLLTDPNEAAGALKAIALQSSLMSRAVPGMADIAQKIRAMEKEEPGMFNPGVERIKNAMAKRTGKKKVEIFGGIL